MKKANYKPRRKRIDDAAFSGPPNHHKRRKPQNAKRGKQVSSIKHEQLINKAEYIETKEYISTRKISDLQVDDRLKALLLKKGFERPTEIQDKTLEALISGKNLLGIAQTGTGKTAAFLVPIIQRLLKNPTKSYGLVLVPTRELAKQVEEEFRSMTKGLKLFSTCFIGGTNINKDMQNLRRSSHVIIATPGRLLDLVQRKAIDLGVINTLVLDEFDRMLDMGFVNDVKRVLTGMHSRQQTLLFSATIDSKQRSLIQDILGEHTTVKVTSGTHSSDSVDQDIIKLNQGEDKFDYLCNLISNHEYEKVLLFDETKHRVAKLCKKLNQAGIKSDQIHGNKSQSARQQALKDFKSGKVKVLVATDVAARGIDVTDVSHVINYQIPLTLDSYIHRIGRTGRAGKTGKALTFVA